MNRRFSCLRSHLCSSDPQQRHPKPGRASAASSTGEQQQDLNGPVDAEGVASFRANGFLLVKQLIPEEELRQVDRDSLELIERGLAGPFGDGRWNYGEDPEGGMSHWTLTGSLAASHFLIRT